MDSVRGKQSLGQRLGDWSGFIAFVATALAAFASTLTEQPNPLTGPNALPLLGLGVAYVVVGLVGLPAAGPQAPLWRNLLYFGLQLAITTAILYLARLSGFISLLLFPLASNALEMLPRRLAVAVWIILIVIFVTVAALLAGWATAFSAGMVVTAGLAFVVAFTYFALSERTARQEVERLAAELSAANQKLREYAAQVDELATARERNRVAREIHDSLGHFLTVINVQLEAATLLVERDVPRTLEAMYKAKSLAQEGLSEVRRSVAALRASPTASRPLPEAVEALAEELRAAGIIANLQVNGQPRPMPPAAELALYRAAQEALTNIRKHARASRVDLRLDYVPGGPVRLRVQDNGVGAVQGAVEANGGFGLLGLRERLQLVGGQVQLHTAPGEGFTLEVEAPG
jgi:signal transduction histidine kinase